MFSFKQNKKYVLQIHKKIYFKVYISTFNTAYGYYYKINKCF